MESGGGRGGEGAERGGEREGRKGRETRKVEGGVEEIKSVRIG